MPGGSVIEFDETVCKQEAFFFLLLTLNVCLDFAEFPATFGRQRIFKKGVDLCEATFALLR